MATWLKMQKPMPRVAVAWWPGGRTAQKAEETSPRITASTALQHRAGGLQGDVVAFLADRGVAGAQLVGEGLDIAIDEVVIVMLVGQQDFGPRRAGRAAGRTPAAVRQRGGAHAVARGGLRVIRDRCRVSRRSRRSGRRPCGTQRSSVEALDVFAL
jgi:hypothetical protein